MGICCPDFHYNYFLLQRTRLFLFSIFYILLFVPGDRPSIFLEVSMSSSRSLWRQRNFLFLWGGQGISILGSMLSAIARPFLIFHLGGGASEVGIVLALSSLPFVFLALPAGAWIDRWDRKQTMMLSDAGRGLALVSLMLALLLGHISLALIYISALMEGVCSVFFSLAETASLPQVVDKTQLSTATSYNQALISIALLVGPPLGGVLYTINPFLPFGLDAISFLVSVVSLRYITVSFQRPRPALQPHLLHEIQTGVSWLWQEPLHRYLVVMNSLISIALGGSVLVIIRLAAHALPHASSATLPAFTGSLLPFAGVGGIMGAPVCSRLPGWFTLPQMIGGSLWLQGGILTLLIFAPTYGVLAVLFVASYWLWPMFNASVAGYRLARIPDELQGRVNAVYRLFDYAAEPFGALLISVLLSHVGLTATALVRGVIVLGVALHTTFILRQPRASA
jgi:MFS family permease